jgi:alpha-1,2-mannosyltransferase
MRYAPAPVGEGRRVTTHPASLDPGLTRLGLVHALRRVVVVLGFAVLPCVLVLVIVGGSVGDHFAFDFHQFWQGGRDVAHGHSPYPSSGSLPADGTNLGPVAIQDVFRFPYPAAAALAMVPFGLLPFNVAAAFFVLCSAVAVVFALRVLGVTDWRCYGIVFASMTTLGALRLGTFTCLLLLGLALAWRWRDRRVAGPATVACIVALKVFLWPLVVWLLLTRRFASAALAVAFAALLTLGSWAVLGFAGLGEYPHLLDSLSSAVQGKGWSVLALALSVGLSATAGKLLAVVLSCALFVAAFVRTNGERRELALFAVAIAAALLLSPIVWLHYFLLLAAPLAIAYPRLAPAWCLPLAFWVWPFQETGGDTWRICLGLAVLLAVLAATLVPRPRSAPRTT